MVATVTSGIEQGLTDAGAALEAAATFITGTPILMGVFSCALLVAGFKVFKRAKNSVKA